MGTAKVPKQETPDMFRPQWLELKSQEVRFEGQIEKTAGRGPNRSYNDLSLHCTGWRVLSRGVTWSKSHRSYSYAESRV